jgi:molecular chaperone Hsp33
MATACPKRLKAISASPNRFQALSALVFQGGLRAGIHTRLDHPEWEHVKARGISVGTSELTDTQLPLDDLVWRLFHDEVEVRVLGDAPLSKGCRCDLAHISGVIGRFPEEERQSMADSDGIVAVNCEFCAKIFSIPVY